MSLLADLAHLFDLPTEKSMAEYLETVRLGMYLRNKILAGLESDPSTLPKWIYNGFSAGQAPREDSEVILHPRAILKDPFRRGNNILVVCDSYTLAGDATPTNKRHAAAKIFSHRVVVVEEPWNGIEQEHALLLQKYVKRLIRGFPGPQGPYYCGVGADKAFGEVIGQLEFQVGPSVGVGVFAGDECCIASHNLEKITEVAGVVPYFVPKPIQGDWNEVGAHTNDSMRIYGEVIKKEIEKLQLTHKDHIAAYGEGNEHCLRLEIDDINTSSGVADALGASVRVGRDIEKAGKGYFEDWRLLLVVSGLFLIVDMFFNKMEITGSRCTLKFSGADAISRAFSFEKVEWKKLSSGKISHFFFTRFK